MSEPLDESRNQAAQSVSDPDAEPGNLQDKAPRQPDQAEGADDPAETGEGDR